MYPAISKNGRLAQKGRFGHPMSYLYRSASRSAALLGGAALGLAACGAGAHAGPTVPPAGNQPSTTIGTTTAVPTTDPGPPVAANAVSIQNLKFGPSAITVKVGTTVTWTNKDDEAHTVFFEYDGSRSPILVNGANVYSKTFATPGTFVYHCTVHPFMTGTVVVTA
jgi:plastocyanin